MPPEAISVPRRENATAFTRLTEFGHGDLWPSIVRTNLPLFTSQNLMVLSQLPETACKPSGEKAIDCTLFECPESVRMSCPVGTSHNLSAGRSPRIHGLLSEPLNTVDPFGENAT